MNKALEALKRFRDNIRWLEENTSLRHYFENDKLHFKEDLDIIETALKRLEIIDRLNEKHCEDTQKKLKALEIIKEKNVCVKDLINAKTLNIYNCNRDWWEMLVQEQFDLLKEILK